MNSAKSTKKREDAVKILAANFFQVFTICTVQCQKQVAVLYDVS